eukprot:365381-Chlamydomonas_euryale.AAC.11
MAVAREYPWQVPDQGKRKATRDGSLPVSPWRKAGCWAPGHPSTGYLHKARSAWSMAEKAGRAAIQEPHALRAHVTAHCRQSWLGHSNTAGCRTFDVPACGKRNQRG